MSSWILRQTPSGDRFLVCPQIREAGLRHAFTLRPLAADAPGSTAAALKAAGIDADSVVKPRQVHGSVVSVPLGDPPRASPPRADAVLVTREDLPAAVTTADCVGGLLLAPERGAFVVFHAGWKGVLAGVVGNAVARLREACGFHPSGMILATGPSAGKCCYEVGEDVAAPFSALFASEADRRRVFGASPSRRVTLSPASAVGILAAREGLEEGRIHDAGLCTICRPDLCWSWRVHRLDAGRMWTAAALSTASP